RVKDQPPSAPDESLELARRRQIDGLRVALWRYARAHDGRFPSDRTAADFSRPTWQVPGPSGALYVYAGGRRVDDDRPLAYEPEVFGPRRLVLLANGEVREMEWAEIARALEIEER